MALSLFLPIAFNDILEVGLDSGSGLIVLRGSGYLFYCACYAYSFDTYDFQHCIYFIPLQTAFRSCN